MISSFELQNLGENFFLHRNFVSKSVCGEHSSHSEKSIVLISRQQSTTLGCLENQKQIPKAEASVVGHVAGMVADLALQGTFHGLRYVSLRT